MMESGDREIGKAFEEVTTRNVRANVDFSNETRKLVRILEEKIISLEGMVRTYDSKIELIQKQISLLQQKLYAGGSS